MDEVIRERKGLYKECNIPKDEQEESIKDIKKWYSECKDLDELCNELYGEGFDHGNDITIFLMSFFVKKQRK